MKVKKLKLKNFRNYEEETIEIASGTNVFVGKNAQGKTNILEAIYLCTCARSHRTGRDSDLIRDGSDNYQVEINFESDKDLSETIKIEYKTKPQVERNIYYCGFKQDRISDLIGLFHAVIFAPEDVMLIKEGPAGRRRFIDLLISQIKPVYFKSLQLYQQYLKQRNNLLKTLRDMHFEKKTNSVLFDPDIYEFNLLQLTIWTEQLAEMAAYIISTRNQYVLKIGQIASEALAKISEGKEKLIINYKTVPGINPNHDNKQIFQNLIKRYERQQEDDIQRGNTESGSHRDDLELIVDGNLLKDRGSQGQQRSAVLALKLAELEIIEEETNEKPVLLLDDVMSELDENRRKHLLSAFEENQVFITCTDLAQIYPEYKGQLSDQEIKDKIKTDKNELNRSYINFFRVEQGSVKQQFLL
ncbi:MAG: DNA replication/repair protein RecF [Clostridiaceae bacterium]|jgi:DNA replication and repair protein RecF|nr:DNA replication/repair protein RecF [Bacillota bacterium]NLN51502.1 DNA replication/repair protein RecF [Clostridiaceae bacterium]